jgi:hypothetical protein
MQTLYLRLIVECNCCFDRYHPSFLPNLWSILQTTLRPLRLHAGQLRNRDPVSVPHRGAVQRRRVLAGQLRARRRGVLDVDDVVVTRLACCRVPRRAALCH